MKYIKKFERDYNILNIKKYVLWKMKHYVFILEVTNITKNLVYMTRLYKYSEEYNKILPIETMKYVFGYEGVREHVIYSSDNLNECLDLNLLAAPFSTNKYNI